MTACIRMSWLQRRPFRILVPVLLAVVFLYLFFAQTKTHNLKVNQQRKRAREQLDNINAVLQAVKEKIPTTPTKLRKSTSDKEEKLSHYKTSDEVGEIVETKKKRIKTRSSKKRSHIKKQRKSKATRKNRNKQKHEHRFKFLNKVRPRDNESYSISNKKESHLNKKLHQVTRVENEVRNKNICKIEFDYGDVCPPLYTELGGYCKHVKALGDVMDCPDIRRKGRTKLRSTQIVLTRMLKIFDIIAHKYNISYWITSGTLLGAVRHHGFIPWDEDADIQMLFDDYVKLFNCCKDVFPKGMFFQNSETDPHLGPSNRQEKMDLSQPPVGLYKQPWNPRLRDMASCTQYCLSEKCQWEDGLMIDIFIAEDTLAPYKRKGVFPLKQMIFEGFRFPVPNNWRDILQSKYGNYESDIGEDDSRQPQDNADPHHSCRQLEKRRKKRKTKKKKKIV